MDIYFLFENSPYSIQMLIKKEDIYFKALDVFRSVMLLKDDNVEVLIKRICTECRFKFSEATTEYNGFIYINENLSNKIIDKYLDENRIKRGRGRPSTKGVIE